MFTIENILNNRPLSIQDHNSRKRSRSHDMITSEILTTKTRNGGVSLNFENHISSQIPTETKVFKRIFPNLDDSLELKYNHDSSLTTDSSSGKACTRLVD